MSPSHSTSSDRPPFKARDALNAVSKQEAAVMASKGWTGTWQRCGRYEYRKVLMHSTNPDHLVPRVASPTNVPPLQIADRYAAGRRHD